MPQTLNIVGLGKLGGAMAALWMGAGVLRVGSVCNSTQTSAERAVVELGEGTACGAIEHMLPAPVWMISTPDSEISKVAEQLSLSGHLRCGDMVFHCSGALSSDCLDCLRAHGASVGSLHPVRSFADQKLVTESFAGTYCALEGDLDVTEFLKKICLAVQAHVFTIEPQSKVVCHAGHVFASNYVVTAIDVAQRLYRSAGLPEDVVRGLLEPIVRSAVDNLLALGSQRALTGPVVRGEVSVVNEHIRALEELSPLYVALYQTLGGAALEIAKERGELSPQTLEAIAALLGSPYLLPPHST